mgnify:CR=1 FL=1
MITYSIGDSVIRIKNAALARHKSVVVVNSKFVAAVVDAMKRAGLVREFEVKPEDRTIVVQLAYRKKEPVLMDLKLVSTPGLHLYMSVPELVARKKSSLLILTTSKGVLTSKEALKEGVGGEILVEIL